MTAQRRAAAARKRCGGSQSPLALALDKFEPKRRRFKLPEQEKENVASTESLTTTGGVGVKVTTSSSARDLGDTDKEEEQPSSPTPRELSNTLKKQHLEDDEKPTIERDTNRREESDTEYRVGVSEEERARILLECCLSPQPDETIHASEVSKLYSLEPEVQDIREPAASNPPEPSTNEPRAATESSSTEKAETSTSSSSGKNKRALLRSKSVTEMLRSSAARARHANDFIKLLLQECLIQQDIERQASHAIEHCQSGEEHNSVNEELEAERLLRIACMVLIRMVSVVVVSSSKSCTLPIKLLAMSVYLGLQSDH
jgi:translation initiation factor 2 beta subunit (eIF-2beta)/eIF-5